MTGQLLLLCEAVRMSEDLDNGRISSVLKVE